MKANWSSSLLITIGLAVLLVAAMAVAGCTDTANKNPPAVTPVSTPAEVVTSQGSAPAATPATPMQTTTSKQKQTIKISGSTTVLPIVQKAADQYMAAHP